MAVALAAGLVLAASVCAQVDPALAPLEAGLRSLVERHRVPGAGFALVGPEGVRWSLYVGMRDRERALPVGPATRFRAGSVTKVFLGLTVAMLAEKSRLALDSPVAGLVPELAIANPWEDTHPLRVEHLLEHTGGLPDFGFDEVLDRAPPGPRRPLDLLAAGPLPIPVRWPPGSRYAYSNRGYVVAAHLIEKAAGKTWEGVVSERVLGPLGMEDASFDWGERPEGDVALGYLGPEDPAVPWLAPWMRPAAGLLVSLRDLSRLVAMLLSRGKVGDRRILRSLTLARLETPSSSDAARRGLAVGYGLGVARRVNRRIPLLGNYGGGYAAQVAFGYSLEHGLGYVVAFNTSHARTGFEEAQEKLVEVLATIGAGAAGSGEPGAEAPAGIVDPAGWYRIGNPRHQALEFVELPLGTVRVSPSPQGGWWATPLRGPVRRIQAVPGGTREFRIEGDCGPGLVVFEGEEGRILAGDGIHLVEVGAVRGAGLPLGLGLLLGASAWTVLAWFLALVRGSPERGDPVRWLPAGAVLLGATAAVVGVRTPVDRLGLAGAEAWTVWGLGLASGVAAFLGVAAAVRATRTCGRSARTLALAVGLLWAYFAWHGALGLWMGPAPGR